MAQNEVLSVHAILADVFTFSAADLAANRAGQISAAQRARIVKTHYANSHTAWVIFAIIFGLGLAGGSADMIRTGQMGLRFLLLYVGVTAFFGLIVWAFILYNRYQMRRTVQIGEVRSVTGTIRIVSERHERAIQWYFCVGHHRFKIERYSDSVLLQESGIVGREATAFYSEPWHSLLSVVLDGAGHP